MSQFLERAFGPQRRYSIDELQKRLGPDFTFEQVRDILGEGLLEARVPVLVCPMDFVSEKSLKYLRVRPEPLLDILFDGQRYLDIEHLDHEEFFPGEARTALLCDGLPIQDPKCEMRIFESSVAKFLEVCVKNSAGNQQPGTKVADHKEEKRGSKSYEHLAIMQAVLCEIERAVRENCLESITTTGQKARERSICATRLAQRVQDHRNIYPVLKSQDETDAAPHATSQRNIQSKITEALNRKLCKPK
jgi:hypothetical protein